MKFYARSAALIACLLAFTDFAHARKKAFLPKSAASTAAIHQIPRGGGLDKVKTAKVAVTIVGAHAVVDLLAPQKSLSFYGLYSLDPKATFVTLEMGAASMNYVLIPALQLFHGMGFQKAVGYSCLPYIFMTLYKLMNNKHKQIGMPDSNGYIVLGMNSLTALAAIRGLDFAPLMIKIYGIFSAINGALFVLSPKGACDAWKFKNPDKSLLIIMRMYGTVLATHAVACLTQAFYPRKTVLQMIAYGAAMLGLTSFPVAFDLKGRSAKNAYPTYLGYLGCFFGLSYYLLN